MELKEISDIKISPYRCYVRGKIIQTEGDNVNTIGFKDGIAVVEVASSTRDMQKSTDKVTDTKAIDLTKLKKLIVKVDPKTGKKYIHKDGMKLEIVPQMNSPILNLKTVDMKSIVNTTQTGPPGDKKPSLIIKASPNINLSIVNGAPLPKLVPTLNKNLKVLNMTSKKPALTASVSTMTEDLDRKPSTDSVERKEVCTQTESASDGRESPLTESFFNFILGTDNENDDGTPKRMIDTTKLKTKEDIQKFNFFNDMRNALNFDRSGNLPLHDCVMQNNLRDVQKNCIVLRAIKESVNILNQSGFAAIHLAVIHNVDIQILKVLLTCKADVSITDPEGNTTIHLAVEHRRSSMLRLLLNAARETKQSLDTFNYEGFTPLILAVLNQSYVDAQLLLDNGADPNVRDLKSGRTALFHAAECHEINLVELLMQNKADTRIRNFFGTSPHDAMFELEDMPLKIKFCILGREHQRMQAKKKLDPKTLEERRAQTQAHVEQLLANPKKARLQTTPILRKVTTDDLIGRCRKK